MPRMPLAAIAFWLCSLSAALADLPPEAETARQENAALCREAGGNPVETDAYILQPDLNGDGLPDVVMNLMGLTCEGAFSLFCGSAGCPVTVWTSGPQGHDRAWNSYAQDIAIEGGTLRAYLHGQFCSPPRVGAEGCEEVISFSGPRPQTAVADPATADPDVTTPPTADAPATDRWQLRDGGGTAVAVIGGTNGIRSLAAFCLGGQPWLALLLDPAPAADDIRVDFTFSGGTVGGPAQRQDATGGAYVIGLAQNPLLGLLAGRDTSAEIAVQGGATGQISLSGSTRALRAALAPCLTF